MDTMYTIIETLCTRRGIRPGTLCKDLGISRGILSDLKAGRTKKLSAENLSKIAAYFGVPTDYLLGEDTAGEPPVLTARDQRDIARNLEAIMSDLENSGDLMFDGDPMSDEARESIRAALRLGLEAAKLKNKEIYTPKQYKKG